MAKTFTLTSKVYDGRYLEVTCRQTANTEKNTSEISWTLAVKGGNAPYYSTGPTTLTIGGQQAHYSARKSYTTHEFPTGIGSTSGKLTVTHETDGDCSIEVSLTTAIYTDTLSTTKGTWQLDKIQRASQIRASDANIGSCSTVVISRGSSSFTHTVAYQFGKKSGWLDGLGNPVTQSVRHDKTVLNFLLPEDFYGEIPDCAQDSCQLTCTTYYGETVIGQTTCNFTVTADPALCSPAVAGIVSPSDTLTLNLTGGKLIPGISTAFCQVVALAQKEATLVSLTAGGVAMVEGDAKLPGWSLPVVEVIATDSRGYSTVVELPCDYVPYVQVTNLAEVARPQPTADSAVVTLRGSGFSGNFGLQQNSVTATVKFDGRQLTVPLTIRQDGSYLQTVELTNLRYTKSYPVTVTVADKAMTVTRQLTLRKGIPVFDWGESDFSFHVPVDVPSLTVNGTSLESYIRSLLP